MSNSTPPSDAPGATRPCVYCGRPVEQNGSAGRPFRYCRDNDGACQRSARNGRMRERNSPGLAGQVARSWELVERLEIVSGTLAEALHAELSPAGVERQTATVRAEAASHVAGAHTERDEARREAETARAEVARLTDLHTAASARAASHEQFAASARDEIISLKAAVAELTEQRDRAHSAATTEAALRAEAVSARDAAVALADGHRSAAATSRAEADHAVRQLKAALANLEAAQATTQVAVAEAAQAATDLATIQGDLDRVREDLTRTQSDFETTTVARTALEDRLRAAETASAREREAHRKTLWERDAARSEAAAAQSMIVELRAEHLRLVTETSELRGALTAAQADNTAVRDLATAALSQRQPSIVQPQPSTP